MVYVFIRNKIISCDSILPIALEINKKTGQSFKFVTWHHPTFLGIQKNTVIYDCINEIGKFSFIGSRKNRLLDKLFKFFFLIECAYNIVFRKAYIFHFDTLNTGPFKVLSSLISDKRLIMAQTDSSGYSRTVLEVTRRTKDVDDSTRDLAAPKKGNLLAFCDNWPWLRDERIENLKAFKVYHPRSRESWNEYIEENYQNYTSGLNLDKNVITIILGFFGHFGRIRTPDSVEECFRETLDLLNELAIENLTILLKPHIITDLEKLKGILAEYPSLSFHITYLHPSMLAKVSDLFLCNCYSTAVYDGYIQDVPVLEFTDYHETALEITNHKSSRSEYVTHFFNKDKVKFKETLLETLRDSKKTKNYLEPYQSDEGFFSIFS